MKKILIPALIAAALTVAPLGATSALAATPPPHVVIGPIYHTDKPLLIINAAKSSAALITGSGNVSVHWSKQKHNLYVFTLTTTRPTVGEHVVQFATAKGKAAVLNLLSSTAVRFESGDYTLASKSAFIKAIKSAAKTR